jgi:beta-lysine 5,6-aminomutase alpha subunit
MKSKLDLDPLIVDSCHKAAKQVAKSVNTRFKGKSTESIERSIVRLIGIDGVDDNDVPLPNVLIDSLRDSGGLNKGVGYWLGNAMLHTGQDPQTIAKRVSDNELNLTELPVASSPKIYEAIAKYTAQSLSDIRNKMEARRHFYRDIDKSTPPYVYVLTATGNVYEDVNHAKAVAQNGGDIVAVIRSTAQSLLDYVPYGATTEGFGGTYATQENFRIMRKALDDWSVDNSRYIRLSSFCSGLCMPEIAAIGVLEGLDNMVNDALYGILYRDINMERTLIDQNFSRRINGYFGVVINTGEDNYLRTEDALEAASSVVASQMINYHFARNSGVPEAQIGLGNAFEVHPSITNGFLIELAQAQLTRELFPLCPVKYMPPTKHMNGNLLRTHACDTLFNLVTIGTQQGIQTVGVPTEGVFTPHIHDRVMGLENTRYVFNAARDFHEEIEFKKGGFIQQRAQDVLLGACEILENIAENGLFDAIKKKTFGNVSRSLNEGKGLEGVFECAPEYINPVADVLTDDGMEQIWT